MKVGILRSGRGIGEEFRQIWWVRFWAFVVSGLSFVVAKGRRKWLGRKDRLWVRVAQRFGRLVRCAGFLRGVAGGVFVCRARAICWSFLCTSRCRRWIGWVRWE